MKYLFITSFIVLLIATVIPNRAISAGTQREVMTKDTLLINPNTSTVKITYCYDKWDENPTSAINYRYVLSGNDKAYVNIGNKKYSLQEAIDLGIISINGSDFTFVRVLETIFDADENNLLNTEFLSDMRRIWDNCTESEKRSTSNFLTFRRLLEIYEIDIIKDQLPEESRNQIELIKQIYINSSANNQRLIEEEFDNNKQAIVEMYDQIAALLFGGDYNRLVVSNNSNKTIELIIPENILIGTQKEKDYFPVTDFSSQSNVWRSSIIPRKGALIKLGYLKSSEGYNDKFDLNTSLSIMTFQLDNDLEITGTFDENTDEVLYSKLQLIN